ncbi:hypothetical protein A5715_00065 [Mycolicibacter heraklionensis]|nr:hypothetical protein A5715_00065 [Mycolicibacter heraklionensis]
MRSTTIKTRQWPVGIGAATLALLFMAGPAVAEPEDTDPSPTKEANAEEGAPGVRPGSQSEAPSLGAPRFSGTYNVTATYGTATANNTAHLSSPCGGCAVTGPEGGPPAIWTGASWEQTKEGPCGPVHTTFIPTSVVNGYAQTLNATTIGMCGSDKPAISTLTRVGN